MIKYKPKGKVVVKKTKSLRKSEENYLISVIRSVLKFGFKKKDIIKILKKIMVKKSIIQKKVPFQKNILRRSSHQRDFMIIAMKIFLSNILS